jgi:hypothetical protein
MLELKPIHEPHRRSLMDQWTGSVGVVLSAGLH